MDNEGMFDEAQQTVVNKLVGDARVKARDQARTEFDAEATRLAGEAETARLATEKQWEPLVAQHQARIKELEPFEAEVAIYRAMVKDMLGAEVKALGDAAKKAIASLPDTLTDAEKLNWLNANAGLFEAGPTGVGTPRREVTRTGADKKQPFEPPLRL